jgi:FdhD protein
MDPVSQSLPIALESGEVPDATMRVDYRIWNGKTFDRGVRGIPAEVPVALRVNCTDYTVMLATPRDLNDFAYGLLYAEGMIGGPKDVFAIEQEHRVDGTVLRVEISGKAEGGRRRTLAGVSGCGLCGAESLADTVRPIPRVRHRLRVEPAAVERAMGELRDWQPLNASCGALHVAAYVRPDGEIVLSREDVGRHNALDKLIGALLSSGIGPGDGFIAMSSRCSYELVQKAATYGVEMLVTAAAPTSLAVRQADEAGMTLINGARSDQFLIVCGGACIDTVEESSATCTPTR